MLGIIYCVCTVTVILKSVLNMLKENVMAYEINFRTVLLSNLTGRGKAPH